MRSRLVWAAGALALAVALVVGIRIASSRSTTTEPFGVRLGSSLGETRDYFRPPVTGSWTSAAEPEPVLRWKATPDGAPLRAATFEFHSGMLVAARFDLDPASKDAVGPSLELTRGTVIARRPEPSGDVTLTVLSRDCPVHQDEIKRLVAGSR